MSDTANNEAKIVISTDPAQFVKFMTDAARAFRDLEKEGKSSVKKIDSSFRDFGKGVMQGAKAVLAPIVSNAMAPYTLSLAQATEQARAWRAETTRMMGSTGRDWQQIGQEIDQAASKAKRLPGDVLNYADAVQELTGNWDSAKDGIKDYSALSRYLGRQTVEEMTPLAATMENLFGVKGANRARDFFNQAINGAERLGQSGRLALRAFERIAPEMGLHAPKDSDKRGQYMREVAALVPAIQKTLGYSPEQAELSARQLMGVFTGQNLTYLEQQAKSAGVLKKGEYLKKGPRLTRTPAELFEIVNKVMRSHQGGRGRGTDGWRWKKFVEQNIPEFAQELFQEPGFLENLRSGAAPGAGDRLGEIESQFERGDEAKRMEADIRLAIRARKIGAKGLATQDYMTRAEPLKGTDLEEAEQRSFEQEQTEAAMQAGGAMLGVTGAAVAGGAAKVALHVGRGGREHLEQNAPTAALGGMSVMSGVAAIASGIGSSIKSLLGQDRVFKVQVAPGSPSLRGGGGQNR